MRLEKSWKDLEVRICRCGCEECELCRVIAHEIKVIKEAIKTLNLISTRFAPKTEEGAYIKTVINEILEGKLSGVSSLLL